MSFMLPKPKSVTADEVVLKRADWDQVVATLEDLRDDAEDIAAVIAARADDAAAGTRLRAERGAPVEMTIPMDVLKAELAGAHPIRAWRDHRGWSAAELSIRSGIGADVIGELENGKKSGPRETLSRLAQAIGVPIEVLSDDDEEPQVEGEAR